MASKTGAAWAIDIGNNSLKALHLTAERGVLEVMDFDNIQHGKILSGSGVKAPERRELVALSLRKFVSRHLLGNDDIVISVPSQNSFARFVNLPPVERKRIPEIVKFEAVQQIPFDINDVQWDWQLMTEADSPETKIGIFAIKNEVVDSTLEHFSREGLQVSYVQMAPMALYNYSLYDRPDLLKSDNQAVVVLNIGADNTDLVICTKSTVWQRCILIGGNAFTRAIADTFKLNFEKAEKLKRTAPVSKYARQLFQAMRPVFTDLVSEVQRSLGFYTSSNPHVKIMKIIAFGGGTKLRGLLKYLQQTLQIPVERPDSFKRLAMGSGVSAAKFHENVGDFGTVYGLALQALGLARIESNLLPRSIARSLAWAGKGRYFTIAASIFLAVSLLCLVRNSLDNIRYSKNKPTRLQTSGILNEARQAINKLEQIKSKAAQYDAIIQKELKPFNYRDVVPLLHEIIFSALPNEKNNPQQKQIYEDFEKGNVETLTKIPRKQRKQIFITGLTAFYTDDLATARFSEADLQRRLRTTLEEETGEYEDMEGYEDYELMELEMMRERGLIEPEYSPFGIFGAEKGEQKEPGFVVTITGYSPYENIRELLDPLDVENDRSRWGFITRLLHLDDLDVVDGNSPFQLYKKTEPQHFRLIIGEVGWGVQMPAGIGVAQYRFKQDAARGIGEQVLIDPLTKETIGKVAVLDENGKPKLDHTGKKIYKTGDHWFILNAKFIWKDAPATSTSTATATAPVGYPTVRPKVPSSSTQGDRTTKVREFGRKAVPGFGDF